MILDIAAYFFLLYSYYTFSWKWSTGKMMSTEQLTLIIRSILQKPVGDVMEATPIFIDSL